MVTTQRSFEHTENKQNKNAKSTVCLRPQVTSINRAHFKKTFCSRVVLQAAYLRVLRHCECRKSKCAQLATSEQLAFRKASNEAARSQLLFPSGVFIKQQQHLNSAYMCIQTGIAGMLL